MKVVVCLDAKNKIQWVKSFDWYKENKGWDDEHIEKDVTDANAEAVEKNYSITFDIVNVPKELENLVTFLIGEKNYKLYSDIDDLDDSINELSGELSSIQGDVYRLTNAMDRIEEKFSSIKELLNK